MDRLEALRAVCVTNESLERLRQTFQGDVRSVRRMERIRNLPDLLQILARQDLLNDSSIQKIWRIVAPHEVRNVQRLPTADLPAEMIRIHELIAKKIGRQWKEFARKLDVNENEIDDYDFDLRKDSRRITLQILTKFRQDYLFHNPQEWLSQIRKALDYARRNDIYEDVDNMIIHIGGLERLCW